MTAETDTPETTIAPEATTTATTGTPPVETFDREYVEKLRRENASYRTKATKAEEAAAEATKTAERSKLDEVERIKAEKVDIEKKIAIAEARATAAERRAAITGKVADAAAALKLLDSDKHLDADGNVNVDALLTDYPFLKPPQAGSGISSIAGANPRGAKDPTQMSDEEFFASRTKKE